MVSDFLPSDYMPHWAGLSQDRSSTSADTQAGAASKVASVAMTNGLGIGGRDNGPLYRSGDLMDGDRPVLAWRAQPSLNATAGSAGPERSIDQGSGFRAIDLSTSSEGPVHA